MTKSTQSISLAVDGTADASNSTTTAPVATIAANNDRDFKMVINAPIARVSRISGDKTTSGNPIAIIHRPNSAFGITRSEDQLLADLRGSFLIDESVDSIMDDEVTDILRELQSGEYSVSGEIADYAKGSKYVLDEFSREVKGNPTLLGQERVRNNDTGIVKRGVFLTFKKTAEAKMQDKVAKSAGKEVSRLFSGFTPSAPTAHSNAPAMVQQGGGEAAEEVKPTEPATTAPAVTEGQPAEKVAEESADNATAKSAEESADNATAKSAEEVVVTA